MTNKHLHVGRGGVNCPCCFPNKGSKARRKAFKRAKVKELKLALKEAIKELLS